MIRFQSHLYLFLALFSVFIFHCTREKCPSYLVFCSQENKSAKCQPKEGRFIGGRHYISSEMLTEDGNWDYQKMHHYFDKKAGFYPDQDCLPIKPPISLREKLQEVSETIDMER